MQAPLDWLLSGPAFVKYRTVKDLLGEPDSSPVVKDSRSAMLQQPGVIGLIQSIQDWPGKVLSSHKSASQSFHTLNYLTDLGLTIEDPGMEMVAEKILASVSPEGPFRLPLNIGKNYGGSGEDIAGWALCDAPNQVYALCQLGLGDDPRVVKAAAYLTGLVKDFGWPCAVSAELGGFRGPGPKTAPCPYANLAMLKMLALKPEWRALPATETGINTLLHLWEARLTEHPFIFYMGTDFCKLKAPLIWYDILHVADVFSRFPAAISSPAFSEILEIIKEKATPDGRFIPESVYQPYKNWDFGQKKDASPWLTFLVYRILQRFEAHHRQPEKS